MADGHHLKLITKLTGSLMLSQMYVIQKPTRILHQMRPGLTKDMRSKCGGVYISILRTSAAETNLKAFRKLYPLKPNTS